MKSLLISCLLASASFVAFAADASTATAPIPKNWCPAGTLDKITLIKPDTVGSVDILDQCKIKNGISLTIDGTAVATAEGGEASTVSFNGGTVGARSIVIVKGASDHEVAKAMVPLNINIQNNVFEQDAHLYVSGSFSPNSVISISGNQFRFGRPLDHRFPGGFLNHTAIGIAIGEVYLWENTQLRIINNDLRAKDSKGRFMLQAISIREGLYWYGQNSSLEIAHNKINVECAPNLFNNTLCAYGVRGDTTMHMYVKDSKFLVDHNEFNITGGLMFKMPNFLAHMASARISASYNKGWSYSEKNPATCTVRRYAPFTEFGILNLGAQTYLNVDYNTFFCKGKSGILGFPTDFTATDHVFASVQGNQITTRGCSPSIYFMNTFALTQKSILWITGNVNSRADTATSGLASIYFAGEFSIQHDAEFTINNNTFGNAGTIKHKTKMVGLAPSAINSWKVEEQASIHMCNNIYNGTLLVDEDELKPHIALKMQEVVIVDECRSERRPHSDDFEPGGADDIVFEAAEFGDDASMEFTKAIINDDKPELDTENTNEDEIAIAENIAPSVESEL